MDHFSSVVDTKRLIVSGWRIPVRRILTPSAMPGGARLTVRRLLRLSSPVIPACWLTCRRRWRSILTMRRMRGIYSWTPSPLLTVMCSVGDLLPRSGGGMACQAAGKPWQAYACLKCRRAAPAALPFLPVMV